MSDILLKDLTIEDIELVRNWRNSEEVAPYMYNENYITQEQQEKWFKKISSETNSKYWIIEFVFNELKLNKLRCEVFVTNDKVIKMHEKFGFRREAYYREHCIKGKQKLDVVGLALLESDWNVYKIIMKSKIYGESN